MVGFLIVFFARPVYSSSLIRCVIWKSAVKMFQFAASWHREAKVFVEILFILFIHKHQNYFVIVRPTHFLCSKQKKLCLKEYTLWNQEYWCAKTCNTCSICCSICGMKIMYKSTFWHKNVLHVTWHPIVLPKRT